MAAWSDVLIRTHTAAASLAIPPTPRSKNTEVGDNGNEWPRAKAEEGKEEELSHFVCLTAMADLLMLPKAMLSDHGVRKEVGLLTYYKPPIISL